MDEPQIEALKRRNAEMMALFRGSLAVSASSSQEEIQQNILDLVEELTARLPLNRAVISALRLFRASICGSSISTSLLASL